LHAPGRPLKEAEEDLSVLRSRSGKPSPFFWDSGILGKREMEEKGAQRLHSLGKLMTKLSALGAYWDLASRKSSGQLGPCLKELIDVVWSRLYNVGGAEVLI
jgi:hypothetical protein